MTAKQTCATCHRVQYQDGFCFVCYSDMLARDDRAVGVRRMSERSIEVPEFDGLYQQLAGMIGKEVSIHLHAGHSVCGVLEHVGGNYVRLARRGPRWQEGVDTINVGAIAMVSVGV